MNASHLGLSIPKSITLCILSICGDLFCSDLLQEEAHLITAKQGIDLWAQWTVVRSHFIAV